MSSFKKGQLSFWRVLVQCDQVSPKMGNLFLLLSHSKDSQWQVQTYFNLMLSLYAITRSEGSSGFHCNSRSSREEPSLLDRLPLLWRLALSRPGRPGLTVVRRVGVWGACAPASPPAQASLVHQHLKALQFTTQRLVLFLRLTGTQVCWERKRREGEWEGRENRRWKEEDGKSHEQWRKKYPNVILK